MRRTLCLVALGALPSFAHAQRLSADWSLLERSRAHAATPTAAAITAADLRTRLFMIADDSMQGRLITSPGNVKTVEYVASEFKRLGLEPAGDNGTYFQRIPVVERMLDSTKTMRIGDEPLVFWRDVVPRDQGSGVRTIAGIPTVYAGVWGTKNLIPENSARDQVVVLASQPTEMGSQIQGLPSRPAVTQYFKDAAGIIVVGAEKIPTDQMAGFRQGSGPVLQEPGPSLPAYLYMTTDAANRLFDGGLAAATPGQKGRALTGQPEWLEQPTALPVRNVVAILRGSDPKLKAEYVAVGAHNDHIGTLPGGIAHDSSYVMTHLFEVEGADSPTPTLDDGERARMAGALAAIRARTHGASTRRDSVFNGADDDGSGTVTLLELAEYFARQATRPKRSLLFVSHVGEEEGLYGSLYFTDHPTVPRDSIVTQLNMDMIGRGDSMDVTGTTKDGREIFGGPDYLQLVGSRRLSTELGDLVERVNRASAHPLVFDYSMDADGHPQNIYCRSDHYAYARYGIPIVFFTTGGHADYHQVTDEPQYIDYDRMARVGNLVKDVATAVANLDHRPKVDKPKPDPHGACQQ